MKPTFRTQRSHVTPQKIPLGKTRKWGLLILGVVLWLAIWLHESWKTNFLSLAHAKNHATPKRAQCLIRAYPHALSKVRGNRIIWKDGSSMVFDDGKNKGFRQKLRNPDLEDTLSLRYRAGKKYSIPPKRNHDPGRMRNLSFLKKMYGSSKSKVRKQLVTIRWMPRTTSHVIKISKTNGVHRRLKAVSQRLDKLPFRIRKFLKKKPSTFLWRHVRGTRRLSAHSFGIAIDVAVSRADYWRWDRKLRYRNRIPMKIVTAFEKEGFIWGGKWYHYDTMHFEYRPELLVSPCVLPPPLNVKNKPQ